MHLKVSETVTKAEVFTESIFSKCGRMCNNKQPAKERAADVIAAQNRANGIRHRRDNQSQKKKKKKKLKKTRVERERYNSCGGGSG